MTHEIVFPNRCAPGKFLNVSANLVVTLTTLDKLDPSGKSLESLSNNSPEKAASTKVEWVAWRRKSGEERQISM